MEMKLTKLKAAIDSYDYEYQQLQISLHSTYVLAETYYTKQYELATNALKTKSSYQNPEMPEDFEQMIGNMENFGFELEALIKSLNQEYSDLQISRNNALQHFQNSRDMANALAQSRAAENIARMKQALKTRSPRSVGIM